MRRTVVLLVAVVFVSALALIWVLRPAEIQPAEMVPARLLGLVIINRFPDSLDFLPKTRLGEWLDLDQAEIQNRLAGEWFASLKGSLDRACLVVHTLERKESGTFRPHITAFLRPKSNRTAAVEDWIREEVVERFGESKTKIMEEASAQVIRGSEEGQILYLAIERGWLIVSNSMAGWKDVQLTLADRIPNLGARQSFRTIQTHIGSDMDLFFYFSGEGTAPLLAEFGYGMRVDGEEVTDNYWAAGEGTSNVEPQSNLE